MSREIDERVVEMQFDNQKFEAGANQSIETLKRLDNSLNFENTGKSFDQIQNAASSLSFSPLASSIDAVQEKFSALEYMAIGAFMRIGSQIENTAVRMVKSFTTDNIAAGWKKFGDKTNSVATLVSQGYELDTVNKQMDRLNWFTDETSYNFTDMVSNIAKFTATGQDLETSVTAMEGIATWAALSGQNAQKASSAMYQLSQAMSKGALKYDDFKSIQNASMDTQEFRQKALESAEALGKIKKNGEDAYSVFNGTKWVDFTKNEMFSSDALSRTEWFTSDVMMETFNKYSSAVNELYDAVESGDYDTASEAIEAMGDNVDAFGLKAFKAAQQARTWGDVIDATKDAVSTGWMKTFELIFGNYEQATELWTGLANGLYDIFAEPLNAQNEALQAWNDKGGRDDLIEGFKNIWHAFENFVAPISYAWDKIFPSETITGFSKSARGLLKFTEGFKNATKKLADFMEPMAELEDTDGVDKNFLKQFSGIEEGAGDISKSANKVDTDLLKLYSDVEEKEGYIASDASVERVDKMHRAFIGLFSVVQLVKDAFSAAAFEAKQLFDKFMELVGIPVFDAILTGLATIGDYFTNLRSNLKEVEFFPKLFGKIGKTIQLVLEIVVKVVSNLISKVGELWDKLKNSEGIQKLKAAFEKLRSVIVDIVFNAFDGLNGFLSGIAIGESDFNIIDVLANALSFLAGVIGDILNLISGHAGEVSNFLGEFAKGSFGIAGDAFELIGKGISEFFGLLKEAGSNLSFEGIDNLFNVIKDGAITAALVTLTDLFGTFKKSVASIPEAINGVIDATKGAIKSFSNKNNAEALFKLAEGIALIAGSMFLLGLLKPEVIEQVTGTMVTLMILAAGLLALYNKFKSSGDSGGEKSNPISSIIENLTSSFTGMLKSIGQGFKFAGIGVFLVGLGIAIGLLANTVKKISEMDWDKAQFGVQQVIVLVAALLGLTAVFDKFTDKGIGVSNAIGFIGLAAAIAIMTKAVGTICDLVAEYSSDVVQNAVNQVILILAAMVGLATVYGKFGGKGIGAFQAVAFVLIAAAVEILMKSVTSMVNAIKASDANTVWAAVFMVIGMIAAITAMGVAIGKAKLPGITKLLGLSVFVIAVSNALMVIFPLIMELASQDWSVLGKVGVIIIALIGVIAALGMISSYLGQNGGSFTGAVSIVILVVALKMLAEVLPVLGANSENASRGIGIMAGALVLLLGAGAIALFLKEGLMTVALAAMGFGVSAILIGAAAVLIAQAFKIVSEAIPIFIDAIIYLGQSIQTHGNEIAIAIGTVLLAIFGAIVMAKSGLIAAIVTLSTGFMEGIATALPAMLQSAWTMIVTILAFLIAIMPELVNTTVDLVIRFFNNLLEAINAASPRIINVIQRLLQVLWNIVVDCVAALADTVGLGDVVRDKLRVELIPALEAAGTEAGEAYTGKVEETINKSNIEVNPKTITKPTEEAYDQARFTAEGESYKLGTTQVQKQAEGISDNSDMLVSAEGINMQAVSDYLGSSEISEMMSQGGIDITRFTGEGMTENAESIMNPAGNTVGDKAAEGVEQKRPEMENAGKYITRGVPVGMTSEEVLKAVEDGGIKVGKRAVKGVEIGSQVKSPSRATMWVGTMIGEGLIVGMIDKVKDVKDSAKEMAEKGIGAIENATKGIYNALNDDLNLNPVIRPVLDDSGIQNGIGNVNSMFDRLALATGTTYTGNLSGIRSANNPNNLGETIDKAVRKAIGDISDNVTDRLSTNTTIEVPLNIDGKRVAKATAQYTRGELARLDKYNSRKGGKV